MKSLYYQIVNFVQNMDFVWYVCIWCGLLALTLMTFVKFYKTHKVGDEKKAGNATYILLAIIFFVLLAVWTYLKK